MNFANNIQAIRDRARKHIEEGSMTEGYGLDREQAIKILNEALATEYMCVLRYRFHYFMATGINSSAVKKEFMEHAEEEQGHADELAERIKQLGGKPELHPSVIAERSHSEYREGTSLADMIREDLIAERIAIESYREMVRYFGDKDSTSRVMLEGILAKEEEHADEMADLLFAVQPDTNRNSQQQYFSDEVPAKAKQTKVKS